VMDLLVRGCGIPLIALSVFVCLLSRPPDE
jgi:hypothetical protein